MTSVKRIESAALVLLLAATGCPDSTMGMDAGPEPDMQPDAEPDVQPDAEPDMLVDPFANLPTLTPVDGSVTVGPEGGSADFGSFSLDIPAGALTEDTVMTAGVAASPSTPAAYGPPLGPVIEFAPSGLSFLIPAKFSLLLDVDPPPPVGDTSGFFLISRSASGDIDRLGLLPGETDGRTVRALMWHFSEASAHGTRAEGQTVDDIADAGCSTEKVAALSKQIRGVLNELLEELPTEVVLDGVSIGNRIGDWAPNDPPIAHSELISSLETVRDLAIAGGGETLHINAAWRSVAQQYVLSTCGNALDTAEVGESFHLLGAGLDAQAIGGVYDACTAAFPDKSGAELRDHLHPVWGALLEANGFRWYGTSRPTTPCRDATHFTHQGAAGTDFRDKAVLAFQTLWNRRNPCAPIPDTEWGRTDTPGLSVTFAKLGGAPAAGFVDAAELPLPAEGGGCTGENESCCPPDMENEEPYCAVSCGEPDAGILDAGLPSPDAGIPVDGGVSTVDAGVNDDGGTPQTARLFTADRSFDALYAHDPGQLVNGFSGTPATVATEPLPASGIAGLQPTGVAVDGNGNVWVASCHITTGPELYPELVRYDASQLTSGTNGPVVPPIAIDLNTPEECAQDLAFDAAGRLYIAAYQDGVAILEPEQLLASASITPILIGGGGFAGVDGVAIGPDGSLWAAYYNFARVEHYAASDTLVTGSPTPLGLWEGAPFSGPADVDFDFSGFMWVTDFGNEVLYGFDAAAQASPTLPAATRIVTSADLGGPEAGAFDSQGNLWIPNWGNSNLVMFTAADLAVGGNLSAAVIITGTEIQRPYTVAFSPAPGNVYAP